MKTMQQIKKIKLKRRPVTECLIDFEEGTAIDKIIERYDGTVVKV